MKRPYKIALITTGAVLVFLLIAAHLLPLIWGRFFMPAESERILNLKPNVISQFPPCPEDWQKVELGNFSIRLPLPDVESMYRLSDESTLSFGFTEFRLMLSGITMSDYAKELGLKYEDVYSSFSDRTGAYFATPQDLRLFRSPIQNYKTLISLILKSMLTFVQEIIVCETEQKKVHIMRMNTADMISGEIYSSDEKFCLNVIIACDKSSKFDKKLELVGGIEILSSKRDLAKYQEDLKRLQAQCGIEIEEMPMPPMPAVEE